MKNRFSPDIYEINICDNSLWEEKNKTRSFRGDSNSIALRMHLEGQSPLCKFVPHYAAHSTEENATLMILEIHTATNIDFNAA